MFGLENNAFGEPAASCPDSEQHIARRSLIWGFLIPEQVCKGVKALSALSLLWRHIYLAPPCQRLTSLQLKMVCLTKVMLAVCRA